jgi:protein-tyrosine phosphatase
MAAETSVNNGDFLGDHLELSSAGTGPWHDGEPMHTSTAATLRRGGYPDHPHVARQFPTARLARFDLMVALDRRHQQTLRSLGADPDRIKMLRAFDPASGAAVDVPDPYYGDDAVFDDCRDMIAAACAGLVTSLTTNWDALTIH